jgi:hypothetical protein
MSATLFFHGPIEAGTFDGATPPREPGRHRYTPIEGPGHDEMQTMRRTGLQPRCHYDEDGMRVSFTVRDCPRYGLLDLIDFESAPIPAE